MIVIILNAIVQADTLGSWAIALVFSSVVFFAGNRISKLIEKIDSVTEFVVRQMEKNGHTDEKIDALHDKHNKLETELKDQVNRMEKKLDHFITEIRKDRIT